MSTGQPTGTRGGARAGAGRKPVGNRPVQLRLTPDLVEIAQRIDREAGGKGSITEGVRRALRAAAEKDPT